MKTIKTILAILVAAVALTACTHNDGDIGIWFGTWQVEAIDDMNTNAPLAGYPSEAHLYFQFQGQMAAMRLADALHTEQVDYGTWSEGDGTLDIHFADPDAAYSHVFAYVLGVPPAERLHFVVTQRSSSRVVLVHGDGQGGNWMLILRKQ